MQAALNLKTRRTFVAMAVHVGRLLQQLHAWSGLRVDRFAELASYDVKTVYYHFGRPSLSTGIIDRYEAGFRKAGWDVDIYGMLSRMARGLPPIPASNAPTPTLPDPSDASVASEPNTGYVSRKAKADVDQQLASLLAQAAELLRDRSGAGQAEPNEDDEAIRRRADRGDQP